MKRILVLGAGQSSPALVRYLLAQSEKQRWRVTVADIDPALAAKRVGGHRNGTAIPFNVNDIDRLHSLVAEADIVANLLSPAFQVSVVEACLLGKTHMVSASYESPMVRKLNDVARRKGVLILNEMGLDPGIDHMTAVDTISRIHARGGRIKSFSSYGSGIPAPDRRLNPLDYVITWNPRNVVMAGQNGAQYFENGEIKIVPPHRVFERTWQMEVDGVGQLEAYPNRDSLVYLEHFDLESARTMIRGTLRYPGFSETWLHIVRLGLPNETIHIPALSNRSWAELLSMFLPVSEGRGNLRNRVARHLDINPTGAIMDRLDWLGLFSEEKIGAEVDTAADAMIHLLKKKLALPKDARDMVILLHRFEMEYPDAEPSRLVSTFVYYGEPGGDTAMALTVGLPAAIAVKLILNGELDMTGCRIPVIPEIYRPVLDELESEFGIRFNERIEPLGETGAVD